MFGQYGTRTVECGLLTGYFGGLSVKTKLYEQLSKKRGQRLQTLRIE